MVAPKPAPGGSNTGGVGAATSDQPPASPGISREGWLCLATVSIGYMLVSWGMAPVSSILPTISAELGIDVSAAGWIMNAYFLLLVGAVLVTGRLGDVIGHRSIFSGGVAVFGLAGVAAGLAGSYEALVVARSIQGVGSAMVFGTSLALVSEVMPTNRRGFAIGILTTSSAVAALAGVTFSVYAVEQLTWHWAFYIMGPIALAAFVMGLRLPRGQTSGSRQQIDWLGAILLFAGLTVGMLSLNHFHEGEQSFREGAYYHVSLHIVAGLILAVFVYVELRVPQPLLLLPMLREPRFASGIFANGIAHMSMLASSFLIPFLLERGRGLPPGDTGRMMLVMQITMVTCSLLSGYLYDRFRTPLFSWGTLASIAAGLTTLGLAGGSLPYWALLGIAVFLGGGLGGFTTVNNTAIMGHAGAGKRGFASGMVETTRQLGHSVGVTLSSTIMAGALVGVSTADLPAAYASGFQQATLLMGGFTALGLLSALTPYIGRSRGDGSRRRRATAQSAPAS
jgi:MFS transporter, DHA2 family, methylenomycin A resistance protein